MMRLGPVLLALLIATPLHADGFSRPPRPPKAELATPAAFFAEQKTCVSANDGCRTCSNKAGKLACSTEAFACVPKAWVCTDGAK